MNSLTIIYIGTAVFSIIIALLLVRLAMLTGQARVRAQEEKRLRKGLTSSLYTKESLRENLLSELNEVVESKERREEIARTVSDIFNKELEKKIELSKQELNKEYKEVLDRKSQSEDIAWKKYKKVLSDKRETEAVIRSIAEGLVVVDAKGNVIMMNPAAENLLDVSRKDKIGRPILENLRREQLVSLTKGGPGSKNGREIEIISQEDETKRILRSSSAVIENENGKTVGMVSVLTDITRQKELDRLKSNFVSNVTHELRTPLVAVQKAIALLLGGTAGRVSGTQEEFLSLAERNLKRLSILIDDLLDLSKLEAGKMQIRRQRVSIVKVVDECVENLHTWARTKSINIDKEADKDIPEIEIDPDRIAQVLNNLIGNAIKFTPENGNIKIQTSIRNNDEVQVSVEDTGIGIAKEDLGKIFDKFYQAGERVATDISGTGVGLSIAKEIVELHKGKIWVESEKGYKTKFIFTLPIGA